MTPILYLLLLLHHVFPLPILQWVEFKSQFYPFFKVHLKYHFFHETFSDFQRWNWSFHYLCSFGLSYSTYILSWILVMYEARPRNVKWLSKNTLLVRGKDLGGRGTYLIEGRDSIWSICFLNAQHKIWCIEGSQHMLVDWMKRKEGEKRRKRGKAFLFLGLAWH